MPELVPDDGARPIPGSEPDPVAPSGAPPGGDLASDLRRRYIGLILNSFERGLVDPDEYTYRLSLLEAASDEAVMQRVVQETTFLGMGRLPSPGPAPGSSSVGPAKAGASRPRELPPGFAEGALDPVALALIGQGAAGSSSRRRDGATGTTRRWVALMAVGIIFLALMILGVILAASVHPAGSGTSGGLRTPVAAGWRPLSTST